MGTAHHYGKGHPLASPKIGSYLLPNSRAEPSLIKHGVLFDNLEQVREITERRLRPYNEERPLDALGGLPAAICREKIAAAKSSTYVWST